MIFCGMLDLCRIIFGIVVDLFRPRAALEAEILVFRQPIIVLRRGRPADSARTRDKESQYTNVNPRLKRANARPRQRERTEQDARCKQ